MESNLKKSNGARRGKKSQGGTTKKYASKQEVRLLERQAGMAKTRQTLWNLGRSSSVPFMKGIQGPRPGANYTVRQLAATFGDSTGLSNVGGSSSAAQLIQNSATAVYFAIAFQLSDLTQATTFSALFDQYRLERVRIHFKSRNPATFVANTASPNAGVPTGYVVVDRDDASAPTAMSDLYQYENVIGFNGYDSFSVDLVPSLTSALYAAGAFSGYSTRDSDGMWIDIANTSVPAYGVKGGVGVLTATTTSSWVWDIIAEYVVSFRKTR